jgi:molecular chaperone DnaK
VYQTEKLLKEQGDKISGDEKERVESGLASLKEALAGTDLEAIKTATESLVSASQGFAQRLYEQASAESAATAGEPSASAPNDDEVVDAEIVDDQQTGS